MNGHVAVFRLLMLVCDIKHAILHGFISQFPSLFFTT
jgi:hypothetical protein